MTDPPRRRTSSTAPTPTVDDVRAASRRLAARIAPEGRLQLPQALPPWPDAASLGNLAAPARDPDTPAADLPGASLARPALVGDAAGPRADQSEGDATPADPPPSAQGRGATGPPGWADPPRTPGPVGTPAESSPGVGVASPPAFDTAGEVADLGPGSGWANPGDVPAMTPPDFAAVVATRPDFGPTTRIAPAPIGPDFRPGDGPDAFGDLGEAPGVPGRLPALVAGLAAVPPTVGDGASPGGAGPSPFGAGEDDFGLAPQASPFADAGGAADLSRTNELLQQILDALRRSSGPSLDGAGPAEFAGRL